MGMNTAPMCPDVIKCAREAGVPPEYILLGLLAFVVIVVFVAFCPLPTPHIKGNKE